jgi:hypothetical protein
MLPVQGVYIHEMSPPADLLLSIRRFIGGNCHIVFAGTLFVNMKRENVRPLAERY